MADAVVRFAVGNGRGVRAATWKCWARRGVSKNDVYLACREIGSALKMSMHESGDWHLAFERGFLTRRGGAGEWPTRVVDSWPRPAAQTPGFTRACSIYTPEAAVRTTTPGDRTGAVTWIAPPPPGQAIETTIVMTDPSVELRSWPGARSMRTSLVGSFVLDSGGRVWIVSRVIPAVPLTAKVNRVRRFTGADPPADGLVRALLVSVEPDGSRTLFEAVGHLGESRLSGEASAERDLLPSAQPPEPSSKPDWE